MRVDGKQTRTVWMEGKVVRMIDQPRLPHTFQIADLLDHHQTAEAISTMVVRGAGAIGATGAYGIAQAALEAPDEGFHGFMAEAAQTMASTRPTAQNLFYGIRSVMAAIEAEGSNIERARSAAVAAAPASRAAPAAFDPGVGIRRSSNRSQASPQSASTTSGSVGARAVVSIRNQPHGAVTRAASRSRAAAEACPARCV